ncbi:MAG: G5 domain-containing protein, partial [Oscillospiraceae bacterium]
EKEVIPFETNYRKTPLLGKNQTRTLVNGSDGELKKTFKNTLTNKEVTDSELIEEKILKEPKDASVLVGGNVPVSNLDFGVPLDANGNPVNYKAVFKNQICTGYSGNNARGASGKRLSAGSVAVRASQFPYGTKLYIKSTDGSFIYGSAVAADTGLGLVQNAIDIDLFYDSYMESCLNGRRILDVYVL